MNKLEFSSVFSDETALFRTPAEPEPGDRVRLRVRTARGSARCVTLVETETPRSVPMQRIASDAFFDIYEGSLICTEDVLSYCFLIETEKERIVCQKNGVWYLEPGEMPDGSAAFRYTPGFHVPDWARGAVQYQIFIDRFRNGCKTADVDSGEYYYVDGHTEHADWDAPVGTHDIRVFYGGDLQGVREKLDYLQELGVEVIYFNPIFVSPSSHKYDTQDYEHIDPHLAVIAEEEKYTMQGWEKHNGFAREYISRVASAKNLEASDAYFADFCRELHKRGMRIILDGVFNHCGSYNKWMDREGIYVSRPNFRKGAFQDATSPYRKFFRFDETSGKADAPYEGWWNYVTLPKLNYEESKALREKIMTVAEKWASPPYSIDGWRLDVAADLGHSPAYNHDFWREFRRRVKKVNPDIVIIAEHYGDASSWLQGDQWDTVMNYDAFMEPLTYFLTGMEKHSDSFNCDLYQNGAEFFRRMRANMARLQAPSIACAMNELSNHDHSRFLTRTNKRVGRLASAGSAAATEGVDKSILREAVAVQMTWPGCPTIYYGDEAGLGGWTDPDCRRTYPWGHEDQELICLHRDLTAIRKKYPIFIRGSVKEVASSYGLIAYARFDEKDMGIVIVNNTAESRTEELSMAEIGVPNGQRFRCVFRSGTDGHACPDTLTEPVAHEHLAVSVRAHSAVILVPESGK